MENNIVFFNSAALEFHSEKACVKDLLSKNTLLFYTQINTKIKAVSNQIIPMYWFSFFSKTPDFEQKITQFYNGYLNDMESLNNIPNVQKKFKNNKIIAKTLLQECDLIETMLETNLIPVASWTDLKNRYREINVVLASLLNDSIFFENSPKIKQIRLKYVEALDKDTENFPTKKLEKRKSQSQIPPKKTETLPTPPLEKTATLSAKTAESLFEIYQIEYNLLIEEKKQIRFSAHPDMERRNRVNEKLQLLYQKMKTLFSQNTCKPWDSLLFTQIIFENIPGGKAKAFSFRQQFIDLFRNRSQEISILQKQFKDTVQEIDLKQNELQKIRNNRDGINFSLETLLRGTEIEILYDEIQKLNKQKEEIELALYFIVLSQTIEGIKILSKRIRDTKKSIASQAENIRRLKEEMGVLLAIQSGLGSQSGLSSHLNINIEAKRSLVEKIDQKRKEIQKKKPKITKMNLEKEILTDLLSEYERKLETLEREQSFDNARLKEFQEKLAFLDEQFNTMHKDYSRTWKPEKNFWKRISNTIWKTFTLGLAKPKQIIAHPQELLHKHHLAKMGYYPLEVLKEWLVEAQKAEDPRAFILEQLSIFREWGDHHPNTACNIAGKLTLAISTLGENNAFIRFISALRGRTYAYQIIGKVIQSIDEPLETEKELWCLALADILQSGPELASFAVMLKNSTSINGIFSLGATIAGQMFTTLTNDSITTLLETFQIHEEVKALHYCRAAVNATISLPYLDSILELEKVKMIRQRGYGMKIAMSPGQVASEALMDLKMSYRKWMRLVKESKTMDSKTKKFKTDWVQRAIRLIPAAIVSSIVSVFTIAILKRGRPISFPSAVSFSTLVSPILLGFPKWIELANELPSFKRTVERVELLEAEEAYEEYFYNKVDAVRVDVDESIAELENYNALIQFSLKEIDETSKETFFKNPQNKQNYTSVLNEIYTDLEKTLQKEYAEAMEVNSQEIFTDSKGVKFLSRKARIVHLFNLNLLSQEKVKNQIRQLFDQKLPKDMDPLLLENLIQFCSIEVRYLLIQKWLKPHLLDALYAEMIQFYKENGTFPIFESISTAQKKKDLRKILLDEWLKEAERMQEIHKYEPVKRSKLSMLGDTFTSIASKFPQKFTNSEFCPPQ